MIQVVILLLTIALNQYVFSAFKNRKLLIFGIDLIVGALVFGVMSIIFDLRVVGLSYGIAPSISESQDQDIWVCGFLLIVGLFSIAVSMFLPNKSKDNV